MKGSAAITCVLSALSFGCGAVYAEAPASLSPTEQGVVTRERQSLDDALHVDQIQQMSPEEIKQRCQQPASVNIRIDKNLPSYTRERPDGAGWQGNEQLLQGLAYMQYGFEIEFTIERIGTIAGYCVRVSELEISAGTEAPVVYLRPDLKEGSCEYNVTLQHEHEHVQNFYDHLERFGVQVEKDLPSILSGLTYREVSSQDLMDAAEKSIKNDIMDIIADIHDHSLTISRSLDAHMDSADEYMRLSNICRIPPAIRR